ncbi:hypothetical protein [Agromyces sp. SYSU T00194]|uniref:hypothetical protein n=1 Tax=Agromyces chitinivorans TaxID=3158560 RepID=UPI003397B6A7
MEDAPAPRRPDRALIGIGIAIVVVIVAAVVAVLLRGEPEQFDETTPEGVVQRYSTAVIDGDTQAAMDLLAPEVVDACERVEPYEDDVRVALVSATDRGDTASVEVTIITSYSGGLFGPDEYRSDGRFSLVRSGDGWLIESAPWELAVCAPGAFG